MSPLEAAALEIAEWAHKPQVRKVSGQPYINHPNRVVAKLKTLRGTNEIDYAGGQLHDVLEDVAEAWDKDRDGFIEPPQDLRNFFKKYAVRMPDRVSRVEFTNLWAELIHARCGEEVLEMVRGLTYPTEGQEWKYKSRAEKNTIRYEHTAQMSDREKRAKLVDRWDNCCDMVGANKGWIAKYIPESYKIHSICGYVDPQMAKELFQAIENLEKYVQGK
jgi:hypothetical protein